MLGSMSVKPLCRILVFLVVAAYVDATVPQVAPTYAANAEISHAAMSGMTHEEDSPGGKMPCKGMLPGCVTDLGCIFLVSLPPPDLTLVTVTAWSSIIYPGSNQPLRGRAIKPALGPPISAA
jgi:hypothetical protein